MNNQKGNKSLPQRGPAVLSPEVIKDICDNRNIKGAQAAMAAKHNISTHRVSRVWATYFGGTKLADAKTGLKKQLPKAPVAQSDITMRKLKTERAQYQVREPKTLIAAAKLDIGARAKAVKKVAGKKLEEDLELDKESLANMDDEQAEILAGEVEAGNNSDALLNALNEIVLTNKKIHKDNIKHLRAIYINNVKKNNSNRYNKNVETTSESETDDDPSNSCAIDESENDEPNNVYDEPSEDGRLDERYNDDDRKVFTAGNEGGRVYTAGGDESYYRPCEGEGEQVYRPYSLRCTINNAQNRHSYYDDRDNNIRRQSSARHVGQLDENRKTMESIELTKYRAGAQPVFTNGRTAGPAPRTVQGNNIQTSRPEPSIPSAQYNEGKNGVQQNHSRYDDKFSPPAATSDAIHSTGGARSGQIVAGISWLKPRPI